MSLRCLTVAGTALCLAASAVGAQDPTPNRLLLPPVVAVFEAGPTQLVRHGQWSHEAATHVTALWPEALAGRATSVESLSREQSAAVAEFQRLALAVARRAKQERRVGSDGLAAFDARLGPSLAFLARDPGPATVVGLVALQIEQGTASLATQAAMAASMIVQPVLVFLPAVTGVNLLAFEADARTGQLLWYEFDRAVEVGGINTGDLRDADSSARLLQTLAARLPATPPPTPAVPRAAAASTDRASATTPLEGYFRVKVPAAWTTQTERRSIAATRDGDNLNAIEVRLAPRSEVFRKTRPETRSDSTPEQFAQWFTAELQATAPYDLQVLDAGATGAVAGEPAFRVHYLHRAWIDGPLLETILVGVSGTRGLLLASLTAPHLEYFARALPDFEKMLPTLERAPIRN